MIFNHYGRCFVNMVRAPNEKPNVRHFGQATRLKCSSECMTPFAPNWSKASLFITILCVPWRRMRDLHGYRPSVMPIITPAIAASVTKRHIEAGDTRRRQLIFKEVYASLKTQLSHRERKGIGTRAERGQVLTK